MVYAHPEPRSMNGALRDVAVRALEGLGHTVVVSDLYAMNWKAAADGTDFLERDATERLRYATDSRKAYEAGQLADDIAAEQSKLLAADAVILQFPLWWFSMPAILKGWIDRVFTNGFAYGLTRPGVRYSARYGEGTLTGRRALVVTSCGAQPAHFSDRGVNGPIDDVLFPITHGILYYTGMEVLEPFVAYGSNRVDDAQFAALAQRYEAKLSGLFAERPIPFRPQNQGDYDDDLRLLPGLEGDATRLAMHRKS